MLYHIIKPDQKVEINNHNKIIDADSVKLFQALMNMQKEQSNQNIELVSMDGATPDDKLIDSGIIDSIKEEKQDKKKSSVGGMSRTDKMKGLDKRNEKRPEK